MAKQKPETIFGIAIRDVGRLRRITQIVAKHGFGEVLSRTPIAKMFSTDAKNADMTTPAPIRFRELLEELGPTFIKLGQILSMRPDIMSPDYIEALGELQDNTPVLPFSEIKEVIESSLGQKISYLFAQFDENPLATASIAQTHRAQTHDGEEVVIKVQRPKIGPMMRADLDLLYLGARIIEAAIEEAKLASPSEIVSEFEKALLTELNFVNELQNIQTAAAFLDPNRNITVPKPFPSLSSARVLTMSFSPGIPIRKLDPETPMAKKAVEEMLHAAAKQIYQDGFFHADPHAGNILYEENGSICMIDLGLMGKLSVEQRDDMVTLTLAAITNDTATLAGILLKMGTPMQRVNISELKSEISRIRSEQLEVEEFGAYDSSAFVQEFVAAASRFKIKLASEYSLLMKAAATIEGIVKLLDPQADLVGIARPYVEKLVAERYSPEAMLKSAMGEAAGMGYRIKALPDLLDQVIHDVGTGNLQVRALTPTLDQLPKHINTLSTRLALSSFAAAMSICSAILFATGPQHNFQWILAIFTVLAAILAWFFTWWMHFIGPGKQIKVLPFLRLFKR